jgi:hypothetical protein
MRKFKLWHTVAAVLAGYCEDPAIGTIDSLLFGLCGDDGLLQYVLGSKPNQLRWPMTNMGWKLAIRSSRRKEQVAPERDLRTNGSEGLVSRANRLRPRHRHRLQWRPLEHVVENGLIGLLDAMCLAKSCYFTLTISSGFQV